MTDRKIQTRKATQETVTVRRAATASMEGPALEIRCQGEAERLAVPDEGLSSLAIRTILVTEGTLSGDLKITPTNTRGCPSGQARFYVPDLTSRQMIGLFADQR
jgi:hypothetical protein